jgi:hypothetical protein
MLQDRSSSRSTEALVGGPSAVDDSPRDRRGEDPTFFIADPLGDSALFSPEPLNKKRPTGVFTVSWARANL